MDIEVQFEAMDIEVQNMDLKHSKISFEVQKIFFRVVSSPKRLSKIFWNIPGLFRLDFIHVFLFQRKPDEK